ncbi:MAG: tRNA uridine-5-carboxymethylaminomethyl(34) synthesis GTPase MnmE, partial [Alphaproteobacteria bacterium]|nr:tRNA uridine-5-carboxymethylaminomethyl(34) synthesis GTPase MnmE [Alphaproteobacteria bacterium]
MPDTIFALSSGAPPAAIAVVRISGPEAGAALERLAGTRPEPRRAALRTLRGTDGKVLDRALVLWFPGPSSSTGEHLAELHLHGGRAVVAAVERALAGMAKLRRATPGEFTRRAFVNGRIDLAEAEGLGDLLEAETELQRRSALALAGGALSRQVGDWRERLLMLSAQAEGALDFSDEDDVSPLCTAFSGELAVLGGEIAEWLARPRSEALREGFKVVLAGPPNAGKSSLFNAMLNREAAIVSDIAGTTRDVLSRSVAIDGVPFQFLDTAGVRKGASDPIERIGIERARAAFSRADLVLWLGPEREGPPGAWEIETRRDLEVRQRKGSPRHTVSALSGEGVPGLLA